MYQNKCDWPSTSSHQIYISDRTVYGNLAFMLFQLSWEYVVVIQTYSERSITSYTHKNTEIEREREHRFPFVFGLLFKSQIWACLWNLLGNREWSKENQIRIIRWIAFVAEILVSFFFQINISSIVRRTMFTHMHTHSHMCVRILYTNRDNFQNLYLKKIPSKHWHLITIMFYSTISYSM